MKGRKQILVVEDEKHIGTLVKYNLEAEGYRVTLVEDGPTALKLLRADPYAFDLIILDLMLPGMSGYAVCETLRNEKVMVPVLILSARSLSEDRTRGFDCGANQYLTKPFDLDELLARAKNLMRLYPQQSTKPMETAGTKLNAIRFGRATINFDTYEVVVDDKDVKMTHKELQLLRYFAENEGRVISRQELLAEVWDMSGDMQTRSVDQFMLRLRRIFELDPAKPKHFLTVRDAGYRFVSDTPQSPDISPPIDELDVTPNP
ncbi:Alkaline phosphatase synthesis transcriptional regulatory protein PhoP [Pirellula sp. SH-Sr6A]|uniref:response regulator transcription factor n=1 Tax=Pirellula sp. SH-Sr6A TaxID=1632865 RepID=UPI00078C91B4|nr:response regulator transcription factor [Pirellula sp. SH-Sr6A]AMV30734.1 Alkaline phosphatase synthesis transcriptional regulatory protein PhoP [Pirellula sp. SH-Sr6A]